MEKYKDMGHKKIKQHEIQPQHVICMPENTMKLNVLNEYGNHH